MTSEVKRLKCAKALEYTLKTRGFVVDHQKFFENFDKIMAELEMQEKTDNGFLTQIANK